MIQKAMKQVGMIFGAPIVVKGRTWFPLVQLITWGIIAWLAGRWDKRRTIVKRIAISAVTMPVVLGSEWGHNLAHAAVADLIDKPADGIMIIGGMPRLIYEDINDNTVTPRQHTLRALGGPMFNLGLLILALFFRHLSSHNSLRREVADIAVKVNAFIGLVALVPIPGIDSGPILKWWLVHSGRNPLQADDIIRKVNGIMGCAMGTTSYIAVKKRWWLPAILLALFTGASLGVACGLIKEQTE